MMGVYQNNEIVGHIEDREIYTEDVDLDAIFYELMDEGVPVHVRDGLVRHEEATPENIKSFLQKYGYTVRDLSESEEEGPGFSPKETKDSGLVVRRTTYRGLPIAIETEAGEVRMGATLAFPYGYIEGAAGVDGDALDCFLGAVSNAPYVYVMHVNKGPAYDEDKCMLGFASADEAIAALRSSYTPDMTFSMTMLPFEEFRNKLVMPRKITADADGEDEPQSAAR